eukprot:m.661942 g.661942  ORF g.661942 m.661942 type:complete len:768 (-) comp58469_c0_seq1:27-2330(-)
MEPQSSSQLHSRQHFYQMQGEPVLRRQPARNPPRTREQPVHRQLRPEQPPSFATRDDLQFEELAELERFYAQRLALRSDPGASADESEFSALSAISSIHPPPARPRSLKFDTEELVRYPVDRTTSLPLDPASNLQPDRRRDFPLQRKEDAHAVEDWARHEGWLLSRADRQAHEELLYLSEQLRLKSEGLAKREAALKQAEAGLRHRHQRSREEDDRQSVSSQISQAASTATAQRATKELVRITEDLQRRTDAAAAREADLARKEAELDLTRNKLENDLERRAEELRSKAKHEIETFKAAFVRERVQDLHRQVEELSGNIKRQRGIIVQLKSSSEEFKTRSQALQEDNTRIQAQLSQSESRVKNLRRDAELQKSRRSESGPRPNALGSTAQPPTSRARSVPGRIARVPQGEDLQPPSGSLVKNGGEERLNPAMLSIFEVIGFLMSEQQQQRSRGREAQDEADDDLPTVGNRPASHSLDSESVRSSSSRRSTSTAASGRRSRQTSAEKSLTPLPDDVAAASARILAPLCDCLDIVASLAPSIQLSFLKFTHYCITATYDAGKQSSVATSLRRVCSLLARGRSPSSSGQSSALIQSDCSEIRVVCALILIRASSEVELVVQAFDCLRAELSAGNAIDEFLASEGHQELLIVMQGGNKLLQSHALDILLTSTMDPAIERAVLPLLCADAWVRSLTFLWASYQTSAAHDVSLLEKLSVLLQKISRARSARSLFEKHGLLYQLKQALTTFAPSHAFLALNLRSVISNVEGPPK